MYTWVYIYKYRQTHSQCGATLGENNPAKIRLIRYTYLQMYKYIRTHTHILTPCWVITGTNNPSMVRFIQIDLYNISLYYQPDHCRVVCSLSHPMWDVYVCVCVWIHVHTPSPHVGRLQVQTPMQCSGSSSGIILYLWDSASERPFIYRALSRSPSITYIRTLIKIHHGPL